MKIVLFGASGVIGQRIAQEALNRGHEVKAVVRDTTRVTFSHPNLTVVAGNIQDAAAVAEATAGYDVVVNSTGPRRDGSEGPDTFFAVAKATIEGVKHSGAKRLIVVGGAGSLEVTPGKQLVDTPEFPAAWLSIANAQRETLGLYRNADLDWTFFSPAALIEPDERTGKYRIGKDQLVTDAQGQSRISAEDYAVALLDEIEHPQFIRQRFTVAY
jgi:uncharacterized protein